MNLQNLGRAYLWYDSGSRSFQYAPGGMEGAGYPAKRYKGKWYWNSEDNMWTLIDDDTIKNLPTDLMGMKGLGNIYYYYDDEGFLCAGYNSTGASPRAKIGKNGRVYIWDNEFPGIDGPGAWVDTGLGIIDFPESLIPNNNFNNSEIITKFNNKKGDTMNISTSGISGKPLYQPIPNDMIEGCISGLSGTLKQVNGKWYYYIEGKGYPAHQKNDGTWWYNKNGYFYKITTLNGLNENDTILTSFKTEWDKLKTEVKTQFCQGVACETEKTGLEKATPYLIGFGLGFVLFKVILK